MMLITKIGVQSGDMKTIKFSMMGQGMCFYGNVALGYLVLGQNSLKFKDYSLDSFNFQFDFYLLILRSGSFLLWFSFY